MLGSFGIGSFLNQSLQHKSILINSAPQDVMFTFDRYHAFIQMPLVTKARCPATDCVGVGPPEFLRPFADCLMSDDDPSINQHVFDQAKAERKEEIQPHRFRDDLG